MAKVFFSFLGISDYKSCNYVLTGEKVSNVRFVQEALVKLLCKDWTEEDKVVIFLTEVAKERNWKDNKYKDEMGNCIKKEGLKSRLDGLGFPVKIKEYMLPEGRSEEEMWYIFDKVFSQIQEGDEIIFDITHAFRSLPLLVMVILNYAKVLKDISIEGVYYGAFEARNGDDAPIFNLTPFVVLFDWATAINNFLLFGDARQLILLATEMIQPILRETRGTDEKTKNLKRLMDLLEVFTENIQTNRGPDIIEKFEYAKLKNLMDQAKESAIVPFNPLFGKLEEKFAEFKDEDIENGYRAVKWCINHNLIQQGYTIFQETIISELVEKFFGKESILEEEPRYLVSQAINIKRRGISEEKWEPPAANNRKKVREIVDALEKEFVELYVNISQDRNDINHAGFKKSATSPKRLKKRLIERVEIFLRNRRKYFHL